MKEVKMFYAKVGNMGDLLNELITENVLGYKVKHCTAKFECQTTGIGSFLGKFFPTKSNLPIFPKNIAGKMYDQIKPPLQIWSSGFIAYPTEEREFPLRKNINFATVRGELTRLRLEKIMNVKLDIPTGDGGLLASYLIKGPINKKYKVGIIPHFREKEELQFKVLADRYDNSIIIDLTDDPLKVIKTISECEYILSSALHGLIVADSFGIPNKRLVLTDKLLGDGYKFDDYYSSFGVKVKAFNLNTNEYLSINNVIDEYDITQKEVEEKKKQLLNSFSNFL